MTTKLWPWPILIMLHNICVAINSFFSGAIKTRQVNTVLGKSLKITSTWGLEVTKQKLLRNACFMSNFVQVQLQGVIKGQFWILDHDAKKTPQSKNYFSRNFNNGVCMGLGMF